MDEQSVEQWRAEHREQCLNECRGRRFVLKTFTAYPSLRSLKPTEDGWYFSEPFTGQDYDAEAFWVCEDGWDHEHCHVCDLHIEPSDEYWECVEYAPTGTRLSWQLCSECYRLLTTPSA